MEPEIIEQRRYTASMVQFGYAFSLFFNNHGDILMKWRDHEPLSAVETQTFLNYLTYVWNIFKKPNDPVPDNMTIADMLNMMLDHGIDPL